MCFVLGCLGLVVGVLGAGCVRVWVWVWLLVTFCCGCLVLCWDARPGCNPGRCGEKMSASYEKETSSWTYRSPSMDSFQKGSNKDPTKGFEWGPQGGSRKGLGARTPLRPHGKARNHPGCLGGMDWHLPA